MTKMYVLLTRPREDSAALAALLQARGITSLIEPMLDIQQIPGVPLATEGVQAFLLTSANGARALAQATAKRDLPVYAVGEATAKLARALGFRMVQSAKGDVASLANLVAECADPKAGVLLHAAGKNVAGDLAGALAKRGLTVRCEAFYEARPAQGLSPRLAGALEKGAIDAVLFFSPRTAGVFVRLVNEAGLAASCERVLAFCLSPAVAEAAKAIHWRGLRVAPSPNVESLLRELEDASAVGRGDNPEG